MNTFKINNTLYVAKPMDFNMVCDMEDYGVSVESMDRKPLSMIRAYFALCAEVDADTAGAEIQKHMITYGDLDSISAAMSKEMEESDFFRALSERTSEETTAVEEEAPKKTTRKSTKA